jgi:transcriptional regulator with XRE-family HTH domain
MRAPRLRAVRERTVMTLRELSAVSGVSANTLVRLERGEDARISTVRRLATALGVEPIELMQAEAEPGHEKAAA